MNRILVSAAFVASAAISSSAAEPPLQLERVVVNDSMVNNMTAGTIFKPSGWKFSGGMKWYPDYCHLVCFEARVFDPNSLEQYEAFPWVTCNWFTKPVIPMDEGHNYMGSVILRPRTPQQVIEEFTIPTARKGARVVGHYPMKEIADLFEKTTGSKVLAVRTRITYGVNAQPVEEDLYLILGYTRAEVTPGNVCTIWQPLAAPFGLRAAKGQLDSATPKLLAIAHSGWLNPKWCDEVGSVKSLFGKRMYKSIEDAGKLSRQITANNDAVLGIMRASRDAKNASEDRAAKKFSDYVRGMATYSDGNTNYHLPNTHGYAWADGRGTVVLTNDPRYNPAGWTQLTPSR